MDNNVLKKIADDSRRLYSLPQTLVEVLRVIKDERSAADDLAKVIMKDPAMTTKILRVVNSPYYGLGRQVSSVSQAVVTLGTRQVTALALSTSVYGMTDNWKSSFDRVRFWRHSLEVAIASRAIAQKMGRKNLEEIFVAGLLHDLGLLILENSYPELFRQVWKKSLRHGGLEELEEAEWGTNHARVGQFILEQWHIPEIICQAVGRHHHTFTMGADDEDLRPAQIVRLANLISKFSIAETPLPNAEIDRENREIIRSNLHLSTDDLLSIEKHLFSWTVSESRYLEIDIGSPESILTEANRMLFDQYAAVELLLDENRRMQQKIAGEQIKTGFLESLRSTTATFARYVDSARTVIMHKARLVEKGLSEGSIMDPSGLVASSVKDIRERMDRIGAMMSEVRKLTETETALYYDQRSVEAVESRIKEELNQLLETADAI
jgi:putative nucleotidyltransferase with HDIG domain